MQQNDIILRFEQTTLEAIEEYTSSWRRQAQDREVRFVVMDDMPWCHHTLEQDDG